MDFVAGWVGLALVKLAQMMVIRPMASFLLYYSRSNEIQLIMQGTPPLLVQPNKIL